MNLNVNESQYKQCEVTPDFSAGQNLFKKILRKVKYWQKLLISKSKYYYNQLRKDF